MPGSDDHCAQLLFGARAPVRRVRRAVETEFDLRAERARPAHGVDRFGDALRLRACAPPPRLLSGGARRLRRRRKSLRIDARAGTIVTGGFVASRPNSPDRRCSRTGSACAGRCSHLPMTMRATARRDTHAGELFSIHRCPSPVGASTSQRRRAVAPRSRRARPCRNAMQCTMSGRSARTIAPDADKARERLDRPEAAPLVLQRHDAAPLGLDPRAVIAHARRDHDLETGRDARCGPSAGNARRKTSPR